MLEYAFFFLVMGILAWAAVWKPGLVLAYILLFQGLNNLTFDLVDLSALRYGATLLAYPAILALHHSSAELGRFSSAVFRSRILQGYLVLAGYLFCYAVFLFVLEPGSGQALGFLGAFLFPGTALFAIGAAMIYAPRVYRDLCWGVLVFSVLTFVAIVAFNIQSLDAFYAERAEAGAATGMSVIAQGRTAGFLALLAVIFTVRLDGLGRAVSAGALILALVWLFLAGSRGPAAALVLALVAYSFVSERRMAPVLYPVLLVAGVGIVVAQLGLQDSPLATRTMAALADPEYVVSTQRYNRWALFFDLLPRHFLFGMGPGAWGAEVWDSPGSYPHNMIIELVLEYGVAGLLALLLMVAAGIRTAYGIIRDHRFGVHHHVLAAGWFYYLLNTMVSGGLVQGNEDFFALTGLMVGLGVIRKVPWRPDGVREAPQAATAP